MMKKSQLEETVIIIVMCPNNKQIELSSDSWSKGSYIGQVDRLLSRAGCPLGFKFWIRLKDNCL